jgi:hypothetical protein
VKFVWSTERETIFQQLKHLLTNAPILKIADAEKDFLVYTNGFKEGLGGFLMQYGHMILYESRKLNDTKHYVTHDLELATTVHTLKMWRNYLLGRRFVFMIDQCGPKYLFDQPQLNSRKSRWMELNNEFDF